MYTIAMKALILSILISTMNLSKLISYTLAITYFTDMFLAHPNLKDLRILRIYSKSIETKYYYGPHSSKV